MKSFFKSRVIFFASLFVSFFSFPNNLKAEVENNWSYGVSGQFSLCSNYGAFVGYRFNDYFGLQTGLGYTSNIFAVYKGGLTDIIKDIENLFSSTINEIEKEFEKNRNELDITLFNNKDVAIQELKTKFNTYNNLLSKKFDQFKVKELGVYDINYLTAPVIARVYPFGGGFAINLGVEFGYLLSVKSLEFSLLFTQASNAIKENLTKSLESVCEKVSNGEINETNAKSEFESTLSSVLGSEAINKMLKEQGIDKDVFNAKSGLWEKKDKVMKLLKDRKEDAKVDDKPLFNKVQIAGLLGFDHTFSFGLILGLMYTHTFRSFVNTFSEGYQTIGDLKLQVRAGLDIAKLIEFIKS